MNLRSILASLLILQVTVSIPCYAPANQWGAPCVSPTPFAGVRGSYVNYHISVLAAVSVYCQAVGIANYTQGTQCFWGWHDLGQINYQYVSLIWDSYNSYPSIRCYGLNAASNLEWTFTTGTSSLTCQKANPFANKISFESEGSFEYVGTDASME